MGETIQFYQTNKAYGCFSNFSRHALVLDGERWPTSEHYFQAQKFVGTPHHEQVRLTPTPMEAAQMGRDRSLPRRNDWESVKDGIMYDAVKAKFAQNEDIQSILLSTKGSVLVEHTKNDSYWADGGDGSGQNRLGLILMRVRDELLQAAATVNTSQQDAHKDSTHGNSLAEDNADQIDDDSDIAPNMNNDADLPDPDSLVHTGRVANMHAGDKPKRGRYSKKRQVFQDADGHATVEKANGQQGRVSLIGEGTTFSEKALPHQARFVVHRHQMRRKYHPSEADFEGDDSDDDQDGYNTLNTSPRSNAAYSLADFMHKGQYEGGDSHDQAVKPAYKEDAGAEGEQEITLSNGECVDAIKSNVELLNALPHDDADRPTIKQACLRLQSSARRRITELSEDYDTNSGVVASLFEALALLDPALS